MTDTLEELHVTSTSWGGVHFPDLLCVQGFGSSCCVGAGRGRLKKEGTGYASINRVTGTEECLKSRDARGSVVLSYGTQRFIRRCKWTHEAQYVIHYTAYGRVGFKTCVRGLKCLVGDLGGS